MNVWLWTALVLLAAEVPLLWRLVRGPLLGSLVALQQAQVVSVLVLMVLAEGIDQPAFFDLAVALALLAPAGGLVFARYMERWQ
ncbi:MAG: monovalent cation/H+ antiporter complex subunit F [Candidatus Dormibacteraceae bacterium]